MSQNLLEILSNDLINGVICYSKHFINSVVNVS